MGTTERETVYSRELRSVESERNTSNGSFVVLLVNHGLHEHQETVSSHQRQHRCRQYFGKVIGVNITLTFQRRLQAVYDGIPCLHWRLIQPNKGKALVRRYSASPADEIAQRNERNDMKTRAQWKALLLLGTLPLCKHTDSPLAPRKEGHSGVLPIHFGPSMHEDELQTSSTTTDMEGPTTTSGVR